MRYLILLIVAIGSLAEAHQWLPTYPKLEPSYVDGVLVTRMELFNSRNDVSFYEVGVFDNDWQPVPFATESGIVNVEYLQRKIIDIYIRERDKQRAVYICTKSKLRDDRNQVTVVSSRICSKIK
jgi:hypothetical protein